MVQDDSLNFILYVPYENLYTKVEKNTLEAKKNNQYYSNKRMRVVVKGPTPPSHKWQKEQSKQGIVSVFVEGGGKKNVIIMFPPYQNRYTVICQIYFISLQ